MAIISTNLDTEELRIKQGGFDGLRQDLQKEVRKLEKERQDFLKRFPISAMANITLDQYKIKSESKNSFCYLLETKLKGLGNIHGATAFKFGIYFGKEKSDPVEKYRWVPRFGNNEAEAFQNVRVAIVDLLDAGRRKDLAAIRQNELSPMFKGKILSTYYPENFLSIFGREHLEFFLDKLGIHYNEGADEVDERNLLMDFKNGDAVMKPWTTYEFMKFLYHAFGWPPKKSSAQKELEGYIEDPGEYPKLSAVKVEIITLEIDHRDIKPEAWHPASHHPTIDFEKEARIHKKLGMRGEEIVLRAEQQHLRTIDRDDLAAKVRWVSQDTDSLGYDIGSFEDDGREKLIEVKSTARSPQAIASFIISSNQYHEAKRLKNYYFYVVFDTKSIAPKIWPIKNPLQYENNGLSLEPINFRVTIHTEID